MPHGEPLGSGTDTWKYWAEFRAGTINDKELAEVEEGIARSPGHCMQLAGVSLATTLKATLPLAAAGILIFLPLEYLWWRWIGYFG